MDISSRLHFSLFVLLLLSNGFGVKAQDARVIKFENSTTEESVTTSQSVLETATHREKSPATLQSASSTKMVVTEEITTQVSTPLITNETSSPQLVTTQQLLPISITPEKNQRPQSTVQFSTTTVANEKNIEASTTALRKSTRETSTSTILSPSQMDDPSTKANLESETTTGDNVETTSDVDMPKSEAHSQSYDQLETKSVNKSTSTAQSFTTNDESGVNNTMSATDLSSTTTVDDKSENTKDATEDTNQTTDSNMTLIYNVTNKDEDPTETVTQLSMNSTSTITQMEIDKTNASSTTQIPAITEPTTNVDSTNETKHDGNETILLDTSTRKTTERSNVADVTPSQETEIKTSSQSSSIAPTSPSPSIDNNSSTTSIPSSNNPPTSPITLINVPSTSSVPMSNNPPTESSATSAATSPISLPNYPSSSVATSSLQNVSNTLNTSNNNGTTTELPKTPTSSSYASNVPPTSQQQSYNFSTSSFSPIVRIPSRQPKWFMLQFTGNCSDAQKRFDDLKKQIRDKILSVARIPDHNVTFKVINCTNTFLLNMSVSPEFEESMSKFFNNLDTTTNATSKFRINDDNYLLKVMTPNGHNAYHQPPEIKLSSRHTDIEFVIYVALGSACAFLLSLAVVLVGCKYCRTKPYKSFDLNDISHLSLRLEDYTLTRIPRPKSIYADYGQGLGSKSQYSPLDDQSAAAGNGMVHAYDTSVVPLEDAPPFKNEGEVESQAFGRGTQTTTTNHDYEEIDVKAVKSTENLHSGPRGSNQWGVDNVSFSTP